MALRSPRHSNGGPDSGRPREPKALWQTIPAKRSSEEPGFVGNVYHYPNTQEPATLWFHDHLLGGTRLNVFASLAAFYFIRGNGDDGMPGKGRRFPRDARKSSSSSRIASSTPTAGCCSRRTPPVGTVAQDANVHPYWMPEFFGDVIVVNGKRGQSSRWSQALPLPAPERREHPLLQPPVLCGDLRSSEAAAERMRRQ